MPASPRSLQITDTYRDRLNALAARLGLLTRHYWTGVNLQDLNRTHAEWLGLVVPMVEQAQRAGVQLTVAYLASFIASEQNVRVMEVPPMRDTFTGLAQDGRPLGETLEPALI